MPSVIRTVSFLAFLAQVLAGVTFTNKKMEMYADTPLTLTWEGEAQGDVTIRLMSGPSDNLQVVDTITSSGADGSFTWTPPADLKSGTYAFEISDESGDDPNYSAPVVFDAEAEPPASTTTTAKTASSTSSASKSDTTLATTTADSNSTTTESSTSTETDKETKTSTRGTTKTADSEPTGSPANLNGGSKSGIKSGASMVALVGLLSFGLVALA